MLVGQGCLGRAQDGKPAHAGVVQGDGLGWGRCAAHAGYCSTGGDGCGIDSVTVTVYNT